MAFNKGDEYARLPDGQAILKSHKNFQLDSRDGLDERSPNGVKPLKRFQSHSISIRLLVKVDRKIQILQNLNFFEKCI